MKKLLFLILALASFGCSKKSVSNTDSDNTITPLPTDVALWLTDPSSSMLFKQQNVQLNFSTAQNSNPTINIDEQQSFQTIDGFGYTLTGGSAYHIHSMDAASRTALLKELFATDANNIGVSYLRVSIGASDLDAQTFSYNDLPTGQTDVNMDKFSIAPDKTHLIPVLKEILAINPAIKILGSPWSPPTWMKTNNSTIGGSLKPEYYDAYAKYFVKYIQRMKAEGITVDAITIQNEPLHPGNNPSLLMLPEEQAAFIKQSLGPLFKKEGITAKIIIYDHNLDKPEYPITILDDADAKSYVDGSAFHLYAGSVEALDQVHKAHPDKNLYFTEQWVGAPGNMKEDVKWHVRNVIIGTMRNWSKIALEWNLAADAKQEPHTPGGCTECLGALTINNGSITRNPAYYVIAHASKFVRPGSTRIMSDMVQNLPNVAFKTPEGKKVLIVLNEGNTVQTFNIKSGSKMVTSTLSAGAVGTYVW